MTTAEKVAQYFLSKDPNREIFTKELVEKNNRTFYKGNARLNKYLHMAQNIYIAKNRKKLFEDDFYAYDNGAVIPSIQENYSIYFSLRGAVEDLSSEEKEFLDKLFILLKDATLEDLIELSHEDDEWKKKQRFYNKENQRMDSLSMIDDYVEQYEDVIEVMDRLVV